MIKRLALTALSIFCFTNAIARAQSGGLVESATGNALRPRESAGQIQTYVPERGRFTFPQPYGTTGVRLTNGSDCGGADCVQPAGYSYWNNINAHTGSDTMLVFLGLERRKGGGGPTLFKYIKTSGETRNLGPLFPSESAYSWATGEGWYFSGTQPTTLYVTMPGASKLERYDVISHALTTVYDVASRPDLFGGGRLIWQSHSSADDRVHSATLKDASYADLGCVAFREDTKQFFYYPQKGLNYDECQIDKSGRWLVIKDKTDSTSEVDNRVIDLETGVERVLLDRNGAGGHSDNGFGVMVAADNMNPQPGAVRLWDFSKDLRGGEPIASVEGQGTLVYQSTSWDYDIGHLSYGNASPGVPVSQQYACGGGASRKDLPRANEIVCFRLDGSLTTLVVAPNLTDLNAPGGGTDDYWKYPKGNLDVTGEYFLWTANSGTSRLDAYIVRIPYGKLVQGAPPSSTPAPAPAPQPAPPASTGTFEAARWMGLANVSASGNSLEKTSGCGGCPDASAASEQVGAAMQFTASETASLRVIGLGSGGLGTQPGDINFAWRLQGGTAEVRESGAYRIETSFAIGDTLKITADGGGVRYWKNGVVVYQNAIPLNHPLRIQAVIYDVNATLNNVMVSR